jgi:transcriptional regulator with XRE-family HTH domain
MPQALDDKQKEILKRLAERVKTVRKSKGLTLEEAGNAGGKDRQSVYRLENGKYNPSIVYLIELCRGLEIDISELLKNIDTETL